MDALVYEDSPIADYLEGEAIPYDLPREDISDCTPFAPRGLPNIRGRLKKIRRSATSIAPGSAYTEELLERFRYIVIASQLLSDEAGPRLSLTEHETLENELTTTRGALITAAISFLAAWALHWIKTRKKSTRTSTWLDVAIYTAGAIAIVVVAALLGRRQYTNFLQQTSVKTLVKYVDESQTLDRTANNVLRFIQEVEVVARGYDIASPLPPITRLEDRQVIRRCQTLRRELAAALKLLTIVMVESHNTMQPYINKTDVQRYHDIYEISLVEYSRAVGLVNRDSQETQESLKELRFSIQLHSLARKVFLCDLLALQQSKGWPRFYQWRNVLQILRDAEQTTLTQQNRLSTTLAEEEWGGSDPKRRSLDVASQSDMENDYGGVHIKKQLRYFDNVAVSVRGLNAKMHLFREEVNNLTNTNTEDNVLSSTLSKHYDSIGHELRSILADWERGKSVLQLPIDTDHERGSCSSESVRTPLSPSPSVGNLQIVDGGPADALRLLNGDSPPAAHRGIFEEEVFEAVASRLPRKRMSIALMTREEKMAKLAEDRKKRATLHEQAENTTNMLRELQMVIKHRPKASLPSNGPAKVNGHRVATL